MAKIIDISIDKKTYSIEFDRNTVGRFMKMQTAYTDDTPEIDKVVDILECGLMKHHEGKNMPSREELLGWIVAIQDIEGLFNAIAGLIQDVLNAVKQDRQEGNAIWGLRK